MNQEEKDALMRSEYETYDRERLIETIFIWRANNRGHSEDCQAMWAANEKLGPIPVGMSRTAAVLQTLNSLAVTP